MPRLVIANIDYLVTVDPSRRIIRDGALVIDNDRIAFDVDGPADLARLAGEPPTRLAGTTR